MKIRVKYGSSKVKSRGTTIMNEKITFEERIVQKVNKESKGRTWNHYTTIN